MSARDKSRTKEKPIRLQKYLSGAGVSSRRMAEELIRAGKVSVNGKIVDQLGVKIIPGIDRVSVEGRLAEIQTPRLYLFFKPRNVITTLSDPEGRPCVGDYLRQTPERVYPVGRLDSDVTGLVVLTNDGDYAERLLHPRYGAERVYWALLDQKPSDQSRQLLLKGVKIDDYIGRAQRVREVKITGLARELFSHIRSNDVLLEVVVTEGKKHFVKRLLKEAGCSLRALGRVGFGPYSLRGVPRGHLRETKFLRLVAKEASAKPRMARVP